MNRFDDSFEQFYPDILASCEGLQRDLHAELNELKSLTGKNIRTAEEEKRGYEVLDSIKAAIRKRIIIMSGSGGLFVTINPLFTESAGERPDSGFPETKEEQLDRCCGLENIKIKGTKKATADARLFLTPWSSSFAHGPDTLLPIGGLAEKILRPGERLTTLKRISWRAPITNDLDLTVIEGEHISNLKKRHTLDGIFETDQGREISFIGRQKKHSPITNIRGPNPVAAEMICLCPKHRPRKSLWGTYKAKLFLPQVEEAYEEQGAGLKFATLAEIITLMMVTAYGNEKDNAALKLMGGINNLTLPDSLDEIIGKKVELKLETKKERVGGSGLRIIPFSYKFPHQKSASTGITAYTESESLAGQHCGEF